jgi:hypothetical protein
MTTGPRYINPWSQFVGCFLPNWLLERPELTLGAKVTYARLAQFAGRKGVAIVRRNVLATKLASSERSVGTYLTELIDCGLIEGKRLGLGRPNQYRFFKHEWMLFRDELDEEEIPDRQDLPIKNGKGCRSAPADVADQLRQDLPARTADVADPSNDKNQRKEKDGATAPDAQPGNPSLFQAPGLPEGSPGSHGSPSPHGAAPPPPATSQNGHGGRRAGTAENVQTVWAAYQESTGKKTASLKGETGAKRRAAITRALKDYPLEDVLDAVRGWKHSPYHTGSNPSGTVYNELTLLLRDAEHIERFRDLARNAKAATNGNGHHADPGDAEAEVRAAREFNARQSARQTAATTTARGAQLAAELAAKGAQ